MITISTSTKTVSLHNSLSLAWLNPRQKATMTALAGNAIQQYAAKNTSAGALTYSGEIKAEDAASIDAMQYAGGTCTLSDGSKVWECVFDATITPTSTGARKQISINFDVVRRYV